MKSKKLIWTRFAVALLVFAMALGLAACVKSKEQSSTTGSDSTEESTTGPDSTGESTTGPDSTGESTTGPDSTEESTTGGENKPSTDDSGVASGEHDDIKDYESVWKITTAG